MNEDLLSPGEAAAFLGVSRQRLTQLREKGQVSAHRVGRFWLYPRSELERRKQEVQRLHAAKRTHDAHQTQS